MKNREAIEIVLELAELGAEKENGYVPEERSSKNYEAIWQVEDFKNDLVRED